MTDSADSARFVPPARRARRSAGVVRTATLALRRAAGTIVLFLVLGLASCQGLWHAAVPFATRPPPAGAPAAGVNPVRAAGDRRPTPATPPAARAAAGAGHRSHG